MQVARGSANNQIHTHVLCSASGSLQNVLVQHMHSTLARASGVTFPAPYRHYVFMRRSSPSLLFGFSLAAFSQHARAAHAAAGSSSSSHQQQQPLTSASGPGGNSSSWGSGSDGHSWGSGGPQNPSPQPLALLAAANKEPLVLTVASFAVTKLAYVRLTKLFREKYLQEKGVDVRFRLTFAGSGVQVRRRVPHDCSRQLGFGDSSHIRCADVRFAHLGRQCCAGDSC
jgi:hypothetical protein